MIIQRMVNKAKDQTKDLPVKMVVLIIIYRDHLTQMMDHNKIFHSVHLNPPVLDSVNNYHLIHRATQDIRQPVIRARVIHKVLIQAPIQLVLVQPFNLLLLALVLFQTFLPPKFHPDQALFHQASHQHRSVPKTTQLCHQIKFPNLVNHRLFHKIFQAAQHHSA